MNLPPEVQAALDTIHEWAESVKPSPNATPKPTPVPQHHVVYTLTPIQPPVKGDPVTNIEFKVHVATGHHYQNRTWTEPITPELQRVFGELDKAAAEMEQA